MTTRPTRATYWRRRATVLAVPTLTVWGAVAAWPDSSPTDAAAAAPASTTVPAAIEQEWPTRLAGPGEEYIWNGLPVICETEGGSLYQPGASLWKLDDNPESMPLCMTDQEAADAEEWLGWGE